MAYTKFVHDQNQTVERACSRRGHISQHRYRLTHHYPVGAELARDEAIPVAINAS